MRSRLLMSFALCVACTTGAAAEARSAPVSLGPADTAESQIAADTEAMQALEVLNKRLEQAGYKDVQIVPQAIVVRAKDGKGNPALLLVDTQTLMALQLQPPENGGGAPGRR
jgi:hypothetical protein